jgi:DNA-binding PadR family transcriptional regulator
MREHFFGHHGPFAGRHEHGRRPWGRRSGRRGNAKYLVLESLVDGPRHGYEIMTTIEERIYRRPSPGSIYPILQALEDAGYVTSEAQEGKRVYTITDAGRQHLAKHEPDEEEIDDVPDARRLLREAIFKLGIAVQGARGSDDATMERIRAILERARREVYAVLASDEPQQV